MHVQTSTLMHIYIMHVCIMHIHMLLDHVCTMHIHMLLDNDAYVHDAYICDIQSLTMLHVCMMRLKFCDQPTNQPTNKAFLGVGFAFILIVHSSGMVLDTWKVTCERWWSRHQWCLPEDWGSANSAMALLP